ncbi:expressed unknown protein [Seminavis robusta]|uniref:MYND-type domain-containing protein n=1 Tax=Seminavis robusta TaxID=568900 RepID=A0A9N8DDG8_9STRA|nr:expressed unknown protein [Seminavis robusta]|eukprot:Sro43_g026330.1 n/a (354) ;mRNA; f:126926-127987
MALGADKKKPEAKRLLRIINKENKTDRDIVDFLMGYVQFKQDDKWNELRVAPFYQYYVSMYREVRQWGYGKPVPVTDTDKKFLSGIIRSDTEPPFFLAHATFLSGFIECKLEQNADMFLHALTRVIDTCDSAKDEDNAHVVVPHTAGEYLMRLRTLTEGFMERTRSNFVMVKWDPNKFVSSMSPIPGDQCDCCGTKEKSTSEMPVCGRCRVTYYCSKECQQKHWQQVHWKLCRKKGEFRCGDVVIALEPFASVGFGGRCRIVSRAKNRTRGLWNVAEMEGEETCVISAAKLRVDSLVVRGLMNQYDQDLVASLMVRKIQEELQKIGELQEDAPDPPETYTAVDLYVMSLEELD